VWQVKQTVDKGKDKAPAGISTIFMLPTEFRASDELESDEEVAVAQWICQQKVQLLRNLKSIYI